jgi:hypothetical protein
VATQHYILAMSLRPAGLMLLCALCTPHPSPAQATAPAAPSVRPALKVHRTSSPVAIDGRLDEPEWLGADSIPNLTQIEPREGGLPSGRTVVRVLALADALVFGIRADDPNASRITSFARQRDAGLTSEDHVRLVLDTYLDGRSGYVFIVNPSGARYDALIANQGEGENSNWDSVWEAATTRDDAGWTLEVRIPVKSLLFRRGLSSWGFNLERRVQRFQETSRWASPNRDAKINMTSGSGLLTGLPDFELGLGLSLRPSGTGKLGRAAAIAPTEADQKVSLDATQRLGANTLAYLTLNTDFAETEVDTRRTNLTRFPLVFPEKRTFFLEGSDYFDFGLGTGDDVRAFFSRRIGLLGGDEVPITAGLKVNGREAGTRFGGLLVRTRDVGALPTGNTMGVFRVRRNLLSESSVGVIGSFGDPQGRPGSWTAGADFTYQTTRLWGDKNFLVGIWGLAMDREDLGGNRHAFGGKIDYPNDLWDIAFTYRRVGEDFDPSLGFVPRLGVQAFNFNLVFQPRPRGRILGLRVRQMFNEFLNTLVTDLQGQWESYRIFTAPVNWRLESGDRIEFNFVPTGERLREPFEIADGVTIPAGAYHWTRWRLEAQFASKRKASGQITWWFGGFYGGTLSELSLTGTLRPWPLLIVELNAGHNVGKLPQGRFVQDVVGTRLRFNFSPDLQLASYVQYDNQTRSIGSNSRLRWSFSPRGELFVVYNHNLNEERDALGSRTGWAFASNQLLAKLQYMFQY